MVQEGASRPVAMTVAGSDSSGGAGIQADLKVFAVLGCVGASAITAITAQNTRGVQRAEVLQADLVVAQIDAVAADLPVAAVKTGMLATTAVITAVAEALRRLGLPHVVVDPVMVAKSGDPLIDADAVGAIAEHLLPLAAVATPNRHEAARLLGYDAITSLPAARDAAKAMCDRFGLRACVVKGIAVGDRMQDAVHLDGAATVLDGPRHAGGGTHGSGCAFSAAITGYLALGRPLNEALPAAKAFIDRAIGGARPLGGGTRPVDPLAVSDPSAALRG